MAVLTIGEAMVLVTPARPEPLEQAVDFRLDVAGAESNVATHLVRAGRPAMWAGAVGNDALGRRLVATLVGRGVDTSLVHVDDRAPTGVFFKDPDVGVTRVWYYRRDSAASLLGPEFVATLPLHDVDLVHLTGITAALSESCLALLDETIIASRRAGIPVSFDVNYRSALWPPARAGPTLLGLARRCDTVFVGRDEAETVWGAKRVDEIRKLVDDPVQLVVKDGAVGAHAFDGDGSTFVPSPAVELVDAVGAGDAFAAGYLSAVLDGEAADAALARGHELAALVVTTTTDV
jgi:2-dehydro-3-deoxygluconokinase